MTEKTEYRERRGNARKSVNLRVWADPGGVLPVIDCRVIDMSDDGAQVEAVAGRDLPDVFTMQVEASRVVGEAHVVWRTPQSVGVKFARRRGR